MKFEGVCIIQESGFGVNSIEIEIVIVSNNRAVPCMGLGQVPVARTLLGISNFFKLFL